jgi:hypothetical protein
MSIVEEYVTSEPNRLHAKTTSCHNLSTKAVLYLGRSIVPSAVKSAEKKRPVSLGSHQIVYKGCSPSPSLRFCPSATKDGADSVTHIDQEDFS